MQLGRPNRILFCGLFMLIFFAGTDPRSLYGQTDASQKENPARAFLFQQAVTHYEAKEYDLAILAAVNMRNMNPKDKTAYRIILASLMAKGDGAKFLDVMRDTEKHQAQDPLFYVWESRILYYLGGFPAALESLKKMEKLLTRQMRQTGGP